MGYINTRSWLKYQANCKDEIKKFRYVIKTWAMNINLDWWIQSYNWCRTRRLGRNVDKWHWSFLSIKHAYWKK